MKLAPYQFQVIYWAKKHNTIADGFSRFLAKWSEKPIVNHSSLPLFLVPLIVIAKSESKLFCSPVLKIFRDPSHP